MGGKRLLKSFRGWGTDSNGNGNSHKGNRAYFYSNPIFLLLEKTRMIFPLSMALVIKYKTTWKCLMTNVMEFPYLDMTNQEKDI